MIVAIAGVIIFAVLPKDAWKKWRARHYSNLAAALAKDGSKEAVQVACLRALALDRDCVPAMRTLLAVLPEKDALSHVLLRLRLADLAPGDRSNLRRLAQLALAVGRFDIAEKVARDLGREVGEVAEVLELRARIPAARGDFRMAAEAARALLAHDERNVAGRLILALAQVFTGAQNEATERELTALASDPTVRMEALRGLRDAALRRKDEPRALEQAEIITADQRANFPDWLTRAELGSRLHPEQTDVLLAELTAHAGRDPRALGRIAGWLRQSGHADRIEPWIAGQEALRRDPQTVELIRAETFSSQREWEKLQALLAEANWRELEFLRVALQARAARGSGDEAAFAKLWRAATALALEDASATRMLADAVRTWPECDREFEMFLWRAAKNGAQNATWVLPELSLRASARKDTRALKRVSDAMVEAWPESKLAKNNAAFYSLLLGVTPDRASALAEELYAAHPREAAIASTYALSLLRRGRAGDALAVLEKLPAEVLQRANLAPYHALALAGTGALGKARERVADVSAADLLPEEQGLLREAGLPLKP